MGPGDGHLAMVDAAADRDGVAPLHVTGADVASLGLDEQPVRKKSKLINGTQRTAAGTTRIEAPRGTWSIIEMLIL